MANIKKLDSLVFLSFIGPYIMAFGIAEFVLVMQFLWKFIDDITGKGIGFLEIMELVFYFSLTIVPLAIPITMLLSSVFVFGNMSENFELTSMKSGGISLMRVMRVGIFMGLFTALFSVYASNILVPQSNYLFIKRFDTIKKSKPTLSLEPGVFNADFANYTIYIGGKDKNGHDISDVYIYDHSRAAGGELALVTAKQGRMYASDDGKFFFITLYDGTQIREINTGPNADKMPFMRTEFSEWTKAFSLQEFNMGDQLFRPGSREFDLMNSFQLQEAIDSMAIQKEKYKKENIDKLGFVFDSDLDPENDPTQSKRQNVVAPSDIKKLSGKSPQTNRKPSPIIAEIKQVGLDSMPLPNSFLATIPEDEQSRIVKTALTIANHKRNFFKNNQVQIRNTELRENVYTLKLHQKYSWALICLLFLFIGAPMGSIIRKGGYGFPLLVSILFFMLFMILKILGEKLMKSGTIDPVTAAWLPNIMIIPAAILLTYLAVNDRKLDVSSISLFRKKKEE